MLLAAVMVVVEKGDNLVQQCADKCLTIRSPEGSAAWFVAFVSYWGVHTPSMLHSAFQATTGMSLNTGSWAIVSPKHPVSLLFFSWSLIFSIFFWFFMATSSRPQSLLYLIFSLKQQCFFKASTSRAAQLKPLCSSWHFELPSPDMGSVFLTLTVRLFWGDFAYISCTFTFVSYFFVGHLSLHLSTLSIHKLEVMVGFTWNLVFISLFSGYMKVMVFSVY